MLGFVNIVVEIVVDMLVDIVTKVMSSFSILPAYQLTLTHCTHWLRPLSPENECRPHWDKATSSSLGAGRSFTACQAGWGRGRGKRQWRRRGRGGSYLACRRWTTIQFVCNLFVHRQRWPLTLLVTSSPPPSAPLSIDRDRVQVYLFRVATNKSLRKQRSNQSQIEIDCRRGRKKQTTTTTTNWRRMQPK